MHAIQPTSDAAFCARLVSRIKHSAPKPASKVEHKRRRDDLRNDYAYEQKRALVIFGAQDCWAGEL